VISAVEEKSHNDNKSQRVKHLEEELAWLVDAIKRKRHSG